MDLHRVIFELTRERNRLQKIIESLENAVLQSGGETGARGKRRGRRSMDDAARQEVSERMKRYWARRRAERNNQPDIPDAAV